MKYKRKFKIHDFIFLWSFSLQIYDPRLCFIKILDLKLENVYENGQKGPNWNEKKIKDQTVTWN